MKHLILILLLALTSCKEDTPAPAGPPTTPPGKSISTVGYGAAIDSTYFAVWSDSSRIRYDTTVTIAAIKYTVLIATGGVRYYYTGSGYAGFEPRPGDVIIFTQPLGYNPSVMVCGTQYTRQTTFTYQSYFYIMTVKTTLEDTVSVTSLLGTFRPCLYIKEMFTLAAGNQTQSENSIGWFAIGPGQIRRVDNDGNLNDLVYGNINGHYWGGSPSSLAESRLNLAVSTTSGLDIRSLLQGAQLSHR